jgi:hypothetical protein
MLCVFFLRQKRYNVYRKKHSVQGVTKQIVLTLTSLQPFFIESGGQRYNTQTYRLMLKLSAKATHPHKEINITLCIFKLF